MFTEDPAGKNASVNACFMYGFPVMLEENMVVPLPPIVIVPRPAAEPHR